MEGNIIDAIELTKELWKSYSKLILVTIVLVIGLVMAFRTFLINKEFGFWKASLRAKNKFFLFIFNASKETLKDICPPFLTRIIFGDTEPKIPIIAFHRESPKETEEWSIDSFLFVNREDEFIGHTELINQLVDEFLDIKEDINEQNAFRWTLLWGDAGSGKSRFALELLIAGEKKLYNSKPQKAWGFISRRMGHSITIDDISEWVFDESAFVILDYAGTHENLKPIIEAMRLRAIKLQQPIRLLLLERKNTGGGLKELDSKSSEDSFLKNTRFDIDSNDIKENIGIKLPPLTDQEVITIIRQRIKRDIGEGEINEWLNDIKQTSSEANERRPLFAAMLGTALSNIDPHTSTQPLNISQRLEKRDTLIRELISRDRNKNWRKNKENLNSEGLYTHENLLALSTFCRGLDYDVFKYGGSASEILIPDKRQFDKQRFFKMASNHDRSLPLGFLEPDFIGELFVLDRLSSSNGPDRREFIDLAWQLGSDRAAQFVRQCHQNHSDLVSDNSYLLPDLGSYTYYVAILMRNLLNDWRRSLDFANNKYESHDLTPFQGIVERATDIFQLLRSHIDSANNLDDSTKLVVADATECYLYIRSWLISPNVRDLKDEQFIADNEITFGLNNKMPVISSPSILNGFYEAAQGIK